MLTALRGAATLKARLQKGIGNSTFPLVEGRCDEGKEANILAALDRVFRGGELLKRTRKGIFTKLVSNNKLINIENQKEKCPDI